MPRLKTLPESKYRVCANKAQIRYFARISKKPGVERNAIHQAFSKYKDKDSLIKGLDAQLENKVCTDKNRATLARHRQRESQYAAVKVESTLTKAVNGGFKKNIQEFFANKALNIAFRAAVPFLQAYCLTEKKYKRVTSASVDELRQQDLLVINELVEKANIAAS